MPGRRSVKCAKCGTTSKEDSSLTFHRFPQPSVHGSLKARVWAKFCFPNDDWSSEESLSALYKQHTMLCDKHYDKSSFTNDDRKKFNKFAIPTEAHDILSELRNTMLHSSTDIQMASVVTADMAQCSTSAEHQMPNADIAQCLTPAEHQMPTADNAQCSMSYETIQGLAQKEKSMMEEMGVRTVAELTPRKQKLYKRCRNNLTEILRLRRKFKKAKKRDRDIISSLNSNSATNDLIKSKLSSSFICYCKAN